MEYPSTGGEAIFTFSPCLCLCLGFGLWPGLLLIQVLLQSLLPLPCLCLFLLPLFLLLQSFRLHLLLLLQPLFLCPCVLLLSGFLLLLLLLPPLHVSLCVITLTFTLTLTPTLTIPTPVGWTFAPLLLVSFPLALCTPPAIPGCTIHIHLLTYLLWEVPCLCRIPCILRCCPPKPVKQPPHLLFFPHHCFFLLRIHRFIVGGPFPRDLMLL